MHLINSDHTSCTNHLKGGKVLSPAKRISLIGRAAGPVRFPLRPDRTAVKFTDQMRAKAFRLWRNVDVPSAMNGRQSLSHVTWNLDNETVWMRFQVNYSDYSMDGYEQRQHSIHFSVADGRITIFLIEFRCCVNLNGSIAKWMTRLHVLSQDLTHILSPKWPPEMTMQLISLSWLHQSQWMRMKLFPSSLTPDIRMNFFFQHFKSPDAGCHVESRDSVTEQVVTSARG